MTQHETEDPTYVGDNVLRNIGLVAALWSALEVQLEFAILRNQEINLSTGMLISANLGFWSKWDLLQTFANEGGISPPMEAKELKNLLDRIRKAYPKRNGIVHAVWIATSDPDVARRKGVRTKGRLRVVDEPMHAEDIQEIADEIREIGADLTAFMERHGLVPEDS